MCKTIPRCGYDVLCRHWELKEEWIPSQVWVTSVKGLPIAVDAHSIMRRNTRLAGQVYPNTNAAMDDVRQTDAYEFLAELRDVFETSALTNSFRTTMGWLSDKDRYECVAIRIPFYHLDGEEMDVVLFCRITRLGLYVSTCKKYTPSIFVKDATKYTLAANGNFNKDIICSGREVN